MSYTAVDSGLSPGLEEGLRLLQPPVGVERLMDVGYLDVLDRREPTGPGSPGRGACDKGLLRELRVGKRRTLLAALELSSGDRVLDVGCGRGACTRRLAKVVGDGLAIGLDTSEQRLEAAVRRTRAANAAYVRGDAGSLPFGEGEFDAVCCIDAFDSFADPVGSLGEMTRVLAAGGRLALSTREVDDDLIGAMARLGLTGIECRKSWRTRAVAARKERGSA